MRPWPPARCARRGYGPATASRSGCRTPPPTSPPTSGLSGSERSRCRSTSCSHHLKSTPGSRRRRRRRTSTVPCPPTASSTARSSNGTRTIRPRCSSPPAPPALPRARSSRTAASAQRRVRRGCARLHRRRRPARRRAVPARARPAGVRLRIPHGRGRLRAAALRARARPRVDGRHADHGDVRCADDVYRALRSGPHGRHAAAAADRAHRRVCGSGRRGAPLRGDVRRGHPRGLRPHRDERPGDDLRARAAPQGGLGRKAVERHRDADRERRTSGESARFSSAAPRSSAATGTTRRPRPRRSTGTAGSRPAISATSTSDGDLFLVDRKKEMIIRGGYNVYPREVEEVLYEHPAVLEAAVVGVPHESLGEDVAAIVVPRPGAELDPEELKAWTKERVAAYKYPRHVVLVAELPKSPTGKILKRSIDLGPLRETGPRRTLSSASSNSGWLTGSLQHSILPSSSAGAGREAAMPARAGEVDREPSRHLASRARSSSSSSS